MRAILIISGLLVRVISITNYLQNFGDEVETNSAEINRPSSSCIYFKNVDRKECGFGPGGGSFI